MYEVCFMARKKVSGEGCERCAALDEMNTRRSNVNIVFAVRAGDAWHDLRQNALGAFRMAETYLASLGFEVTIAPNVFDDAEFAPIAAAFDAMADYKGERLDAHRQTVDPAEAKQRAVTALTNMESAPKRKRRLWETKDYWLRVNTTREPADLSVNGGYVWDWQPVIEQPRYAEPVLP